MFHAFLDSYSDRPLIVFLEIEAIFQPEGLDSVILILIFPFLVYLGIVHLFLFCSHT